MQQTHLNPSFLSTLSAMFLVAGTCIGGAMLALPVSTGMSGFIPSMAIMFLCWLAMTATALLLVEVSLWLPEGAHISTMTKTLLGRPGQVVSWILYLFICYASIVAYTAGAGVQILTGFQAFFGLSLNHPLACLLFVAIFGSAIYLGAQCVGKINTILFIGMLIAYFGLVGMGIQEVNPSLLKNENWPLSIRSVPLLLTSFSFHTMVPSLTPYLKRNPKALRTAVIGGALMAFVIYALWQMLMLGIVPVDGPQGLAEAFIKGEPSTQFLKEHVQGSFVYLIAESFAFFAIATSFLGMTLGLYDFLSDGLHIPKVGWGKVALGILIAVPTLFFATYFERIFLVALETSGGIGDSILSGIIPVLMIIMGRYYLGYSSPYRVFGGKLTLFGLIFFFSLTLLIQIFFLG